VLYVQIYTDQLTIKIFSLVGLFFLLETNPIIGDLTKIALLKVPAYFLHTMEHALYAVCADNRIVAQLQNVKRNIQFVGYRTNSPFALYPSTKQQRKASCRILCKLMQLFGYWEKLVVILGTLTLNISLNEKETSHIRPGLPTNCLV
jgi:hypothetical protein